MTNLLLLGHIGERTVGINMKSYYIIQSEIEVEASDDDTALTLLQDTIGFSGFKMVRWIDTTLSERESNATS
jgi:hypothetical protein